MLFGKVSQLIPEFRMGDVDEFTRSLSQAFTMQICNSVFRDNIMYVPSRSHHTCTFLQMRNDLANRLILCR